MPDTEKNAVDDLGDRVTMGSGNVIMIVMGPVFLFDEKAAAMWRKVGAFPGAELDSAPPGPQGDDVA
ncbi:hypothetical protein ACSI5F_03800 [Ralstonia pseudosolanacearum]|uniref:hypothetical protein n=1 Tax=Ralstonia pseudosolanacearum TaxID=1310165 RepID=UPI003EE16C72